MPISLIYATFPTETAANTVATTLLAEKLIACANIFPIKSHFFWENQSQNEAEFAALFKTTEARAADVMRRVELLHSYKIPCIWKITAEANLAFENWVFEQTKN
jgi:periplasmic divalent cation tolerance protein